MAEKLRTTEISTEKRGPTIIVRVVGELDALAGPQLDEAVARALEDGARRCIVDLTYATFIDSIGVGSLIRSHRAATDRGSGLFLAGARGMIAQLIKITQLTRIFKVFTTLDEAIAAASTEASTEG